MPKNIILNQFVKTLNIPRSRIRSQITILIEK